MAKEKTVTNRDIGKHYLASIILYTILLFAVMLCPVYYNNITNNKIDYSVILGFYLAVYTIAAPIIYLVFRPKSVLDSRPLTILGYIKKQFVRGLPLEAHLNNITPTEKEKQAMMIVFMQVFFATYSAHVLCETYIPNLKYNLDFILVMLQQALYYTSTDGIWAGLSQFIIDTGDIWLKIIFTITTFVYLFSYLSDSVFTRNKIKSIDTTPLGVLSCLCCYFPVSILTLSFIRVTEENLLPVNNTTLLTILNLVVIFANIGSLIAILRLGTKAGNLTNRGIVTGFPYNVIRHPDYTMQIIYIIATSIPLYLTNNNGIFDKIMMTLTTFAWIYIYYLRSITEERHLIQDEKYQEYCKKVRYRFIPKLF